MPASEWSFAERPDVRIVSDELWRRVQVRRNVRRLTNPASTSTVLPSRPMPKRSSREAPSDVTQVSAAPMRRKLGPRPKHGVPIREALTLGRKTAIRVR